MDTHALCTSRRVLDAVLREDVFQDIMYLAGLQDVGFVKASFIPPMLLVRTEKPTEGQDWLYELLCGGLHKISSCGGRRYIALRMRSWLGKHRNGRPTPHNPHQACNSLSSSSAVESSFSEERIVSDEHWQPAAADPP